MIKRPAFVAYPFLAALYPVLALAAAHGGELARPRDLARPLGISLAIAICTWLIAGLVTRAPDRQAILTFVAVVAFAAYGYWQTVALDVLDVPRLASDWVVVPVFAGFIGTTAWAARRPGPSHPGLTRYLNLVMALLVSGTVVGLLWRMLKPRPEVRLADLRPVAAAGDTTTRPHVFVIILDKYTGPRSLRANYGHSNAEFERFLEARGFTVARNAHANYIHTFLALASMLNWQYLDEIADSLSQGERRWDVLYPLVEDNRTVRALKALGYRFVFLPTAFAATAGNDLADLQLPDPDDLTREFETVWLRTTLLKPAVDAWCAHRHCSQQLLPYILESAESFDWKFEQLARLASSAVPLFVLAHLTLPHEPYLYAGDCTRIPPYWPVRDDGPEAGRVKQAYVAQLQCVNRKLGHLVNELEHASARPVVILLQSDHGHGRLGRDQPPLEDAPPDRVSERIDIFAAYHLPGAPADLVHDSIGPVNAMRAVMRYYFGFPLPPLEEATYWSGYLRPYQLTRVR